MRIVGYTAIIRWGKLGPDIYAGLILEQMINGNDRCSGMAGSCMSGNWISPPELSEPEQFQLHSMRQVISLLNLIKVFCLIFCDTLTVLLIRKPTNKISGYFVSTHHICKLMTMLNPSASRDVWYPRLSFLILSKTQADTCANTPNLSRKNIYKKTKAVNFKSQLQKEENTSSNMFYFKLRLSLMRCPHF